MAALLCGAVLSANAEASVSSSHIVKVEQGLISGASDGGVNSYLGIPYAKPPVGSLRWRPTESAEAWSGVRKANEFASECFQVGNFYTSSNVESFDRPYGSEDCLYLNVWSPQSDAEVRPVIVYIHGGGSVHGAASLALYNGKRLAKELDAVFVSLNYRLGFYGLISSPDLRLGDPAGDSGNFALLDQIKALEWVQNNIASFGGDAGNVTVMGQSAGCGSIWHLMRSPLASGKFHKSFCMSGIPNNSDRVDLDKASQKLLFNLLVNDGVISSDKEFQKYLSTTGPEQRRDYLYSKTSLEILSASEGVKLDPAAVDGYVLSDGKGGTLVNNVPSIIGTVDDEAALLFLGGYSKKNYIDLWRLIQSDKPLSRRDFFASIIDYARFKAVVGIVDPVLFYAVDKSTEVLASASAPVYRYHFEWDKSPEPWRTIIGSYHGIDVPFVFGNFERDTPSFTNFTWRGIPLDELERVHAIFAKALRGFIESSDPNKYDSGLNWATWKSADDDLIIE
ncbi:carboxylesterase/lipase family protein [Zhongshania aquimaris]|uniref:Carboxylic ester hydrolase n=1 Tax=Zhongshania aquimaris TaxID=2857107 RepID=A0ABS6VW45_9GAMM|nr:carboxylesterase family protein [Zhongshania aquimaris]MBW2942543.1 carboxylesterase family protein [Zhongshania aquimaris]